MATLQELEAAFVKADDAALKGDKQAADDAAAFAAQIRKMRMMPKPVDNLNAETLDPTKGIGAGQLALEGAGKFVSDTLTGLKQRLTRGDAYQKRALESQVAETEARDKALMDTTAGKLGNVGGAIGMSAPAALIPGANTYLGALLIGGAQGLLTPTKEGDSVAKNVAAGAAGGLVGQGIGNGIARIIRPQTNPQVKLLMDEGVTPTVGQILGGAAQRTEDKITSIPLIGDAISHARNKSLDEFNKAIYARSLNGIAPTPSVVGREGVQEVSQALGDSYNKILSQGTFRYDQAFNGALNNLSNAAKKLPDNLDKRFITELNNRVFNKLDPNTGTMSGEAFKEAYSDLGKIAKGLKSDPISDNRNLGDLLRQAQQELRGAFYRANPSLQSALDQTDKAYANFARLRGAAAMQGAENGVVNPTQFASAVKALNSSVAKGDYANGVAFGQDLSDAAKSVLGQKYADSGTPGRAALGFLLGGGAGAASGQLPLAAAAMIPYLPGGRQAVASLLTQRPAVATPLAELLRGANPAIAGGMGATFADLAQ